MSLLEADIVSVPVRTPAEIACVASLAQRIWPEHYTSIIGAAQVAYMLQCIQSIDAITAQITSGDQYFLVSSAHDDVPDDPPWIGYYSVRSQPETRRMFISKLYLLKTQRGKGLGRAMVDEITLFAKQNHLNTLWLTVNKNNPAFDIYLRWGFVNKGPVVKDIGEGFVMDDFLLEKTV
ncbi:MAG: GNAT family N-acetyltransferase [Steroidobacter sp.]